MDQHLQNATNPNLFNAAGVKTATRDDLLKLYENLHTCTCKFNRMERLDYSVMRRVIEAQNEMILALVSQLKPIAPAEVKPEVAPVKGRKQLVGVK